MVLIQGLCPGVVVRVRTVGGWQLNPLAECFGFRIAKWFSVGLAMVISCAGLCHGLFEPLPTSYIHCVLRSGWLFPCLFIPIVY